MPNYAIYRYGSDYYYFQVNNLVYYANTVFETIRKSSYNTLHTNIRETFMGRLATFTTKVSLLDVPAYLRAFILSQLEKGEKK